MLTEGDNEHLLAAQHHYRTYFNSMGASYPSLPFRYWLRIDPLVLRQRF
jgi:hypothetical protein